jgi:hypothetical protein
VLVGFVASSSSATYNSLPSGYTAHTNSPTTNAWGGYKVVTSTSANTLQFGSNASEATISALAAIRSAGGVGSAPCTFMLMGIGKQC